MQIRLEITERPTSRKAPSFAATPERLIEAVMSTAPGGENDGKAVKFVSDDTNLTPLRLKIAYLCNKAGLKLRSQKLRPLNRNMRRQKDPYEVLLWVEAPRGTGPDQPDREEDSENDT